MDFLKLQMKYVVGGGCQQHKETWWWNKTVDNPVKMKCKVWKKWRNGGSKEEYLKAKRVAKAAVYFSKKDAQAEQCASINNTDKNQIFKIAKRFKQDTRIVVGENCVLNEEGKLILTMDSKHKAWQLDYKKL